MRPASREERRRIGYAAGGSTALTLLLGATVGIITGNVRYAFLLIGAVGVLCLVVGLVLFGILLLRSRQNAG